MSITIEKIKTDISLRCVNFAVLRGLINGTQSKEWIEVAEQNIYNKLKKWQK